MNLEELKKSLSEQNEPSEVLCLLLKALWFDKKGNWNRAHEIAQDVESADGSWVHAYLHRKEGDLSNARYWYRRARRPESSEDLEREWDQIADYLLSKDPSH